MRKLTALFLVLCILFGLCACGINDTHGNNDDKTNIENPGNEQLPEQTLSVIVPEYKDYGRGSTDFNKIVYSRPDLQSVIDSFDAMTEEIKAGTKTADEYITGIIALENPLSTVKTMYSLAEIYQSKDSSDTFWSAEYEYISTNYPKLSQAIEELLVACAASDHRSVFEENYFGYSLEKYADGGIYTDEVVSLLESEAELEAKYSSISTADVTITYQSVGDKSIKWTDTADKVIAKAKEHYANQPDTLERVLIHINDLYLQERGKLEEVILVDLIKIRRQIADELGYESYVTFAYDAMEYDYTPEQMLNLIQDIGKYLDPVAIDLESEIFVNYFLSNPQGTVNSIAVINNLYEVYERLGGDYANAYSYMLQHGLYDVSGYKANRYDGAFATYLETNSSPYLFMTASGFIRDYTTLAHEFGHFLDGFINNGDDDSLTVMEISSQALELLTLIKLKSEMHSSDYGYLEYYTLYTFINSVLLVQSFYAAFEHMVYELKLDEITVENIKAVIDEAYKLVFGENESFVPSLSYVNITHTALYPCYVESYVTSAMASLEIFFAESGKTGASGEGFKLYEALIRRGDKDMTFIERLESAGLTSPFEKGAVKQIADDLYFQITGKHYYKQSDNEINAA